MSELIEKLFVRLSKYDWLTTLVPGLFLFAILRHIGIIIKTISALEEIGLVFLFGVISSRVGASCVEPLARCFKLFEPYEDYIEWSNSDKDKANMLVRNANWFRSLCGMTLILLAIVCVKLVPASALSYDTKLIVAIVLLFALFADSYRRQLSYTTKRIRKFRSEKGVESKQ